MRPILHRAIDPLLPEGFVRWVSYRRRFRQLGMPAAWAWQRRMRTALEVTRIELFPAAVRSSLDVVIDIGANVGSWSTGLWHLTRPRTMLAYEPLPQCAETLRQAALSMPGLKVIEAAIGAQQGTIEITGQTVSELTSIRPLGRAGRRFHASSREVRRFTVPLLTLDSQTANIGTVDVLKIDVQGYEDQVLEGAIETLRKTRSLLIEVNYAPDYYEGGPQFLDLCDVLCKRATADAVFINEELRSGS
jgi:FkbM family methyltransferase